MSDPGTAGADYTERLHSLGDAWWKRPLRPLDPYLWRLRRLRLSRTLDVGCGLGRNLAVLPPGSVGVDHNTTSIAHARARGLDAVTVEEFTRRAYAEGSFDSLLVSHVLEHMSPPEGTALLESYLPFLRAGGRVLLLRPQERGYASDATHVRWTTGEDLVVLCRELGLQPDRPHSFPLPRRAGRAFTHNEFVVRARKP